MYLYLIGTTVVQRVYRFKVISPWKKKQLGSCPTSHTNAANRAVCPLKFQHIEFIAYSEENRVFQSISIFQFYRTGPVGDYYLIILTNAINQFNLDNTSLIVTVYRLSLQIKYKVQIQSALSRRYCYFTRQLVVRSHLNDHEKAHITPIIDWLVTVTTPNYRKEAKNQYEGLIVNL